ncbi:MAG: hypothetical protein HY660_00640 [Armatimonadetes bacterium]|nr:hypothetical protein [Armatimonadota bacterium]
MDSLVELFTRLETLVTRRPALSLLDRRSADYRELAQLVRAIREKIPEDLRQAARLREEAERTLQQAQDEARRIVLEAQTYARRLVSEHAVTREAERQRAHMMDEGRAEADAIRHGSDDYAREVLEELEGRVQDILDAIRKGKAMLDRQTPP